MLSRDPSLYDLPPFYEPDGPSVTLPILIAQTEIGKLTSPHRLLAQEQLGSRPFCVPLTTNLTPNAKSASPSLQSSQKTVQLRRRSLTPAPKSEVSHSPTPSSSTARSQKGIRFSRKSSTPSSPESLASPSEEISSQRGVRFSLTPRPQREFPASPLAELSEESKFTASILTDTESTDEDGLIPKPKGEAGRPGRGGYNLQEALSWPDIDYKRLKVILWQS